MEIPFKKANILIPKNIDMFRWSVIACDQCTSEPKYWKQVEDIVGKEPSTLNLILPEIYLEDKNVSKRINKINKNMIDYLNNDIFTEYKDTLIYVERTQSDNKIRSGLIGMVDLEEYSYEEDSKSLIRATEKTVLERIPPRVKIRENASLELPHIMILIDDNKKEIIENLSNKVKEESKLYDFDLMQNGGHIKGYQLDDKLADAVIKELEKLENKNVSKDKGNLLFAVGDGNHSLATAKACYERIKKKDKDYLNNLARYALVELVNLHSDALEFKEINRVVFDVNTNDLLNELKKYYDIDETTGQKVEIITKDFDKVFYIKNPKSNLSVESIQIFLDEYLNSHSGRIDYIHREDVVKELSSKDNNIGFIFEPIPKKDLFKTVLLNGTLPRKTFSIGCFQDKRYYLEARRIKKDT